MFEYIFGELIPAVQQLVLDLGPLGIFLGMFLESSVIPVPSEVVLVAAGAIGFSVWDIAILGGLGSTAGGIIGYGIGRYGGRPFLDKYGKFLFITEKKLRFVDKWFEKWGNYSVLISRLIPLIPFKIFSIAAGIGRMDFKYFVIFTLIGSIPRAFILGYFGSLLMTMENVFLMILIIIILVSLPLAVTKVGSRSRKQEEKWYR